MAIDEHEVLRQIRITKIKIDMYICTLEKEERTGIDRFLWDSAVNKTTDAIYAAHKEFDLPIALIMAIIEVESSWRPEVVSPKGARGLMQIMPVWDNILRGAGIIDKVEDIFAISNNIRAGCWIFEGYREDARDFSTSEELSLDDAFNRYSGGGGQEYIGKVRETMARIETFMNGE